MSAYKPLTAQDITGPRYGGLTLSTNQDGDGIFCYGHVAPGKFAKAVLKYLKKHDIPATNIDIQEDIKMVWAVLDEDGENIMWGGTPYVGHPGRFPLTVWEA